jgi:hypothetical protein
VTANAQRTVTLWAKKAGTTAKKENGGRHTPKGRNRVILELAD